MATKRIIMGKGLGCQLPEKAWRQLSRPETLCCFTLPLLSIQGMLGQESDTLPQSSPLLLCHCVFCVDFVFFVKLELGGHDWSIHKIFVGRRVMCVLCVFLQIYKSILMKLFIPGSSRTQVIFHKGFFYS